MQKKSIIAAYPHISTYMYDAQMAHAWYEHNKNIANRIKNEWAILLYT